MARRGSLLVLPSRAGPGYRPTGLNVPTSTDRAKGLLPTLNERVLPSDECHDVPKEFGDAGLTC